MPFKTKKQKLRAGSRRISISEQGLATYGQVSKSAEEIDKPVEKIARISYESLASYNYVRGEIIKTVLFALVIIGLQLIIKFSNITF